MADLTLFFNNPNSSDIVLVVNGEQFHLLSDILEKHTDFFKDMKVTSQSISTSKDVIVSLVSKKVVNIEDPFLEKDTVAKVLKFMYGGHLEINATNVNDIFHVSCLGALSSADALHRRRGICQAGARRSGT